MNTVTTTSRNAGNVRQLQVLAIKIGELVSRSQVLLKLTAGKSVTEGLIAVGLCKQAKEQINAACQNLGLAVNTLPQMPGDKVEIEIHLRPAVSGVVQVMQKAIDAPEKAIGDGIETFVSEMLVIAAITVARAEAHVKEGERLARAFK